jgi:hypothetical protein
VSNRRTVSERIARQLDDARPRALPCRLSAASVRAMAREYLARRDAKEKAGGPHWDLWMADGGNKVGPGHFGVVIFWPPPRGISFFAGVSISLPVQRFCLHDRPDDAGELYEAMRRRFVVGGLMRVGRGAAERGLGRGW